MAGLRGGATMTTSHSQVITYLRKFSEPVLMKRGNAIGEEGIEEIIAQIESRFNTGRPASRRRGSAPLNSRGNYDYKVTIVGEGAVQVAWEVANKDPGFQAKFWTLESGARAHRITAGGRHLVYDPADGASTDVQAMPKSVMWTPGGKIGTRFFETAVSRTVSRYGGQNVIPFRIT